jgi:phosphatidate phosphatase
MSNLQPVHWLKVGFDIASCLVLFLFFQTLKIFAKPFKSSFYCNDYSVNMPFKPSTVTNGALILIVFCFPFLVLISTEFVRTLYIRRTTNATTTTTTTNTNNQSSSSNDVNRTRFVYKVKCFDNKILDVSEHIGNLYINCGAFFFGIAVVAVITDFVKYLVGRLRPNFLDVCQPNVDPYRYMSILLWF